MLWMRLSVLIIRRTGSVDSPFWSVARRNASTKSSSERSKFFSSNSMRPEISARPRSNGLSLRAFSISSCAGVPLALRVVEAPEDLEGAVVVRRLQLGDLEQLDRLRRLVLGHVVLRQADVLRGIDLVARALADRLPACTSW